MGRALTFRIPETGHKYVKNLKYVASFLSMQLQTLKDWERKGLVRRTKGGYYHTKQVLEVALSKVGEMESDSTDETIPSDSTSEVLSEQEARARKMSAVAKMAELDLEIKRGLYVSRAIIERERTLQVLTLKQSLMSLGRELAPILLGRDNPLQVQEIIDRSIENRIKIFSGDTEEDIEELVGVFDEKDIYTEEEYKQNG